MKIIINAPCRSTEWRPARSGRPLFRASVAGLRQHREHDDGRGRRRTPDGDASAAPAQSFALNITKVDTTFVTRDHFIAAVEMQLSGEPFAEAMGRDLGGYSRDFSCQACSCDPSLYHDPALNMGTAGGPSARDDLAGFSSAVESYEYSKQPMNNIAFESGAGTSLAFGPVLNAGGATGAAALQGLRAWVQHLASGSNAVSRFVHSDGDRPTTPSAGRGSGHAPALTRRGTRRSRRSNASTGCSISSDDDPGASGSLICNDYECDYTSLHLPNRAAQVKMTIDPGSSGWAGWKEALWVLNYLQVMHDSTEAAVSSVPEAQLAMVGTPGNAVVGADDTGAATASGTYLGSSDIEGFQAGQLPPDPRQPERRSGSRSSPPTDGATLGGFASVSDALAYSPASPLRWFPASISVTESDDASGFPRPTELRHRVARQPSARSRGPARRVLERLLAHRPVERRRRRQPARRSPTSTAIPFPVQNQTPTGDADAARSRARHDARPGREHRSPARRSGDRPLRRRRRPRGRHASRAERRSRPTSPPTRSCRCARRGAPSTECSRSTRTLKPDAKNVPSPLDSFPPLDGMTYAARLDQLVASLVERLLRQAHDRRRPRVRRLGSRRRRRRPTTAPASTRTRRRSAASWSRTSRPATRSSATARRASSRASRAPSTIRRRASTGPPPATRATTGHVHARAGSGCSRERCGTRTSSSRSCPVRRRWRRSSRTASRGSTSSCSTAGTIATETATSSGPASARASPRVPTASLSPGAASRWPSVSSPASPGRSSIRRTQATEVRASSRPIASTTACRRSRRQACPPRWPTRSPSRSLPWSTRERVHLRHDEPAVQRLEVTARRHYCARSRASSRAATPPAPAAAQQTHSSPIATSPDGARLFVVHPDADSVSILDAASRAIVHEVLLGGKAARGRPDDEALRSRPSRRARSP